MSRIGRLIIVIPEGVKVVLNARVLDVSGPNGTLQVEIHPKLTLDISDNTISVKRLDDEKISRSVHGLTRALIANSIEGVSKGFEKQLEIVGVGYKATLDGNDLTLKLGFSHEIKIKPKEGITFEVKKNLLTVKGSDKQLVGQTAAEIRSLKKPEPYKGKGIKYVGEHIIRKVGKAVKGAGA
jgi:large subunit ribosomal protein L6